MSDAPLTPYSSNPYEDEISISELLLKLWAKRGLIVFLPLIFAGLTVVGLLIGKTSQQNEVSYYIELNGITLSKSVASGERDSDKDDSRTSTASDTTATSSGNGNGSGSGSGNIVARYPNGTVFSPQDLTNPTVIALLAGETGLSAQDLAEHIDVPSGGIIRIHRLADVDHFVFIHPL